MTATLLLINAQTIYAQANWIKRGSDPGKYTMGIDSSIQHDKQNVMTIKSIDQEIQGFGTYMQNAKPEQYIGKRIRMTGYMKSKDVPSWAGFWLRVDQVGSQQFLSFDNMQDRPVKGTTDWNKYEIVLDVPNNASNVAFGTLIGGTGQVWFTNPVFDIVDNSVPTTGQKQIAETSNKALLNGVWTEKENGISEIKWAFHSNGIFNSISFWSNPVQIGGGYRVGKFSFDESKNSVKLTFEKNFTATNNSVETYETHDSLDTREWQIKSISENEIVIKRPPFGDFEKKSPKYDGSSIEIRLKKISQQIQDPN